MKTGWLGSMCLGTKSWEESGVTVYDYGFRVYNPGIARFLSVDPLAPDYPWYTPYQFAGNSPVANIDLDGLEPLTMIDKQGKLTEPVIALLRSVAGFDVASLRTSTWKDYLSSFEGRSWFKLTGYPNASVKGEDVFYHGKNLESRSSAQWLGLIFHEETHRQEVDGIGGLAFYLSYGVQGAVMNYREIGTEARAHGNGSNPPYYSDDLVDILLRETDALSIIEDNELSENQKVTNLSLLGKTFRATTVLPNLIQETNGHIDNLDNLISQPDGDTDFNRSLRDGLRKVVSEYNAELNKLNFELDAPSNE